MSKRAQTNILTYSLGAQLIQVIIVAYEIGFAQNQLCILNFKNVLKLTGSYFNSQLHSIYHRILLTKRSYVTIAYSMNTNITALSTVLLSCRKLRVMHVLAARVCCLSIPCNLA
jgi:hypothetical protein